MPDLPLSIGDDIEGIGNAIRYRQVYPGIDLIALVGRGSFKLIAELTDNALDLPTPDTPLLKIDPRITIDPGQLSAFESLVERAAGFEAPIARLPFVLGQADADYLVRYDGSPDEAVLDVAVDPDDTAHLAQLAKARTFAGRMTAGEPLLHAFRLRTATLDQGPTDQGPADGESQEVPPQAVIFALTFTTKADAPTVRPLGPDAKSAATYDPSPSCVKRCRYHGPGDTPCQRICRRIDRKIATGFPVGARHAGACVGGIINHDQERYAYVPFRLDALGGLISGALGEQLRAGEARITGAAIGYEVTDLFPEEGTLKRLPARRCGTGPATPAPCATGSISEFRPASRAPERAHPKP